MEAIVDFDSWLAVYQPTDVRYHAAYDPMSGAVFKVGNRAALSDDTHTITIDNELAEKIIEGSLPIHRCVVNLDTLAVEITEIKAVTKINDVLHRVSDLKYSSTVKHDLKLVYTSAVKTLSIQLTKPNQWSDNGILTFYLTDYNDPNVVYKIISTSITDIKTGAAAYTDIELPSRFSIFTRSSFRNYTLEIV